MLANYNSPSKEETMIKIAETMVKEYEYLISTQSIKFNKVQIKL